ncbi:hypothetical protein BC832DRAFT_614722 [Gaertneriomyces semiglobifer]|nr:hypothetical protein BC832DRAFT_614722 [Gaertneriomyces semiglobifer]
MGKRGKGKHSNAGAQAHPSEAKPEHHEAFQRMNFLYQAAAVVRKSLAESASNAHSGSEKQVGSVSRFYMKTFRQVERRLVLRSHPYVKRTICKQCDSILLSGDAVRHRTTKGRAEHGTNNVPLLESECKTCGLVKRIPLGDQPTRSPYSTRAAYNHDALKQMILIPSYLLGGQSFTRAWHMDVGL